ncbi:MAG TPA: tetratricopeptide repeat protein [Thermoanaerobaculia bacterium]|jgi:pentatricopeptide repeat protein|nr:tetratricopeptide repeat protein [Thermoanaerobaculia bacterium]
MAQPGITAKIEELQFRIKTDPKSRLFFPLAEELRKNGKLTEAEQVLRTGLGVHSAYLSAWVSLGRVLREQHKNSEAVEALTKALQVDPGNVVAARLLADAYLDLGEKVEAIKKYKLVHALMPSDEELQAKIDQLDRDLSPAPPPPVAPPEEPELAFEPEPEPEPAPAEPAAGPFAPPPESPFDDTTPIIHTIETPFDTGDEIPMAAQHAESPFEEPSGYTAAALEIEQPEGMHIEEAPLVAEVPTVWLSDPEPEPVADVFAPAEPERIAADEDDLTSTTTMADLYVRQGLIDEARKIYQHMLDRDPANDELRSKLNALDTSVAEEPIAFEAEPADDEVRETGNPATLHNHAKVAVLQQWLAKVAKREQPGA